MRIWRDSLPGSRSSKRQSATAVACSLNSAKLTPAPSHVAPSGYGRPGRVRKAVSLTNLARSGRDKPEGGQWRQGEDHGVWLPVPRRGLARHAARVADLAAAVQA